MSMTLDQLRYALELQKWKNFSRAAEACHITQPSLSAQIAKLEEELGLALFDRTKTKVVVTEYGEELLRQAKVILEEASRLPEMAHSLKGAVKGKFRLGVIPTLAPSLLPLFLNDFATTYPEVKLTIIEEPTEKLVEQIHVGELDGAILSTPARCPSSLLERVLFYEPFCVFASTGHEILSSKSITPDALSNYEIFLLDESHCLRDQVLQLCKTKAKNSKLEIQSGSLLTLIEVLRKQKGYTLLPSLSLPFLSAQERSKNTRSFASPTPVRKVSLVFHKAHLKRSILDGVQKAIAKHLPEGVFSSQSGKNLRILSPGPEYFDL